MNTTQQYCQVSQCAPCVVGRSLRVQMIMISQWQYLRQLVLVAVHVAAVTVVTIIVHGSESNAGREHI